MQGTYERYYTISRSKHGGCGVAGDFQQRAAPSVGAEPGRVAPLARAVPPITLEQVCHPLGQARADTYGLQRIRQKALSI